MSRAAFSYIAISSSEEEELLSLAFSLSPRIEIRRPGLLLLEVPQKELQGVLEKLAAAGLSLKQAAARTRTAALLALHQRPGSVVPEGREALFLAPFPLPCLEILEDLQPSLLETFRSWGIYTLGDLAALPRSSLGARLGQRGLRLQQLACGRDLFPLRAHRPSPVLLQQESLDWTPDSLEAVAFVLKKLLDRLCGELRQQALAGELLRLECRLGNGALYHCQIRPALPSADPRFLLSLLRLKLQADPPSAGVREVSLRVFPTRPPVLQYSLLEPVCRQPDKLSHTLSRLQALLPGWDLGSPQLEDSHRPDSFYLSSFEPFRKGSPSARSGPTVEGKLPMVLRRIRPPQPIALTPGWIVRCAGPWRCAGNWWDQQRVWWRDEWDVEFRDGRLARIFWDHFRKGWFLDGIYD